MISSESVQLLDYRKTFFL